MKPAEFVKKVRQSVLDENIAIYKNLFERTEADQVSDPYWIEALNLYMRLGEDDKKILFKIIRQVSVDTISNLLAILDGVSCLEGQDGDFNLSLSDKQEKLNGDLQDIFLEIEESL